MASFEEGAKVIYFWKFQNVSFGEVRQKFQATDGPPLDNSYLEKRCNFSE